MVCKKNVVAELSSNERASICTETEAAEQAEAEAEEVLEEVRTKEMGHRGVGRVAN